MRDLTTRAMFLLIASLLITGVPLSAQWLKYKTPGIPRTLDGKPDLTAPAPKMPDGKPDLSGIWQARAGGYAVNIASDLKPGDVEPWAELSTASGPRISASNIPVSDACPISARCLVSVCTRSWKCRV